MAVTKFTASAFSATLATALLYGCGGAPAPVVDTPESPDPPDTPETPEVSDSPAADTPEPAGDDPVAAKELPGEREEAMPGTMPADGKSVRSGSAACCGKGSCGDCTALPEGRKDPKPPAKPHPAQKKPSESVRKGAAACCGEGTCGPC